MKIYIQIISSLILLISCNPKNVENVKGNLLQISDSVLTKNIQIDFSPIQIASKQSLYLKQINNIDFAKFIDKKYLLKSSENPIGIDSNIICNDFGFVEYSSIVSKKNIVDDLSFFYLLNSSTIQKIKPDSVLIHASYSCDFYNNFGKHIRSNQENEFNGTYSIKGYLIGKINENKNVLPHDGLIITSNVELNSVKIFSADSIKIIKNNKKPSQNGSFNGEFIISLTFQNIQYLAYTNESLFDSKHSFMFEISNKGQYLFACFKSIACEWNFQLFELKKTNNELEKLFESFAGCDV